jgi:hypothetical protein
MYATQGYTKCTAYIKAIDPKWWNDERMCKPYWAACVIAESLSEQALKDVGYDYRDWKAEATFPKLEKALGMIPVKNRDFVTPELRGYFGGRGIKTEKIASPDEYWALAKILWPAHISDQGNLTLQDLEFQICRMSKAQRKTAGSRIKDINKKYFT